jgi:hypothetical protein
MKSFLFGLLMTLSLNSHSAEIKEVCKPKTTKEGTVVLDKNKKPVQVCKKIKVHKKLEGTKVPSK